MTTTPSTRPGWVVVLDAFMASSTRTLTNADLGALRGVQAWHQRISDLKRYGYLFTSGKKVANGYYAYRLLGISASVVGGNLPHYLALPKLDPEQARQARLEAELELAEMDKPDGGRLLPSHEDATTLARDADPSLPPAPGAVGVVVDDARLDELLTLLGVPPLSVDAPATGDERVAAAIAAVRELTARAEAAERKAAEAPERRPARARAPRGDRPARGPRAGSGPALMEAVLRDAGGPLHASAIAERVLAKDAERPEDERAYKGKTPAATMAAQLSTSHKKGGTFVRTAPNTYGLRERDADAAVQS